MNFLGNLPQGSGTAPYTSPMKVKLVAKGTPTRSKNGTMYLQIAVADHTGHRKGVVYDETTIDQMSEGKSMMLRNYSVNNGALMLNGRTKISSTSSLQIPKEHHQAAYEIINPPPPPTVLLQECQNRPVGSLVSIRGLIVEEAMERTVKIGADDTITKDITLEEDGAKLTITLWRQFGRHPAIAVGSFVNVTCIVLRKFAGRNVGNTTSRTQISATDRPSRSMTTEIISYEMVDDITVVINCMQGEDVCDLKISQQLLLKAMEVETIQEFEDVLPKSVTLEATGSIVERIVLA